MTDIKNIDGTNGGSSSGNGAGNAEGPAPRMMTPLQAELMDDGVLPEPDIMGIEMAAAGLNLDDVSDDVREMIELEKYTGSLPVFQWEIHPDDSSLPGDEYECKIDGFEYFMWYKEHPSGLVYASIHAMTEGSPAGGCGEGAPTDCSSGSDCGSNPLDEGGQDMIVVNLVYDIHRKGITAIYGTADDFRPFIEVFQRSYGPLAQAVQSDDSTISSTETQKE